MPIQRISSRVIEDGTITPDDIQSGVTFAPGTAMLFAQTTAPTGWTKVTAHNDKALRVVNGTAGSGGTTAFSSVFTSRTAGGTVGATTLTTAQMPSHAHSVWQNAGARVSASANHYNTSTFSNTGFILSASTVAGTFNNGTSNTGSGSSHDHSFTGTAMDFAVAYVDVIIATKD